MLPYAETLMPRWEKLTADSVPAPFHFSNFEESVSKRSVMSQKGVSQQISTDFEFLARTFGPRGGNVTNEDQNLFDPSRRDRRPTV